MVRTGIPTGDGDVIDFDDFEEDDDDGGSTAGGGRGPRFDDDPTPDPPDPEPEPQQSRNPQRGPSGPPNSRQSGGGSLTDQGLGQADAQADRSGGSSSSSSSGSSSGGVTSTAGGGRGPRFDAESPGEAARVDESSTARRGPTPDQVSPDTRSEPDGFIENRVRPLAEQYTESVAEPVGDFVRDATPITTIERNVAGTNRSGRFFESAGENLAQLGNVPGAVVGVRD